MHVILSGNFLQNSQARGFEERFAFRQDNNSKHKKTEVASCDSDSGRKRNLKVTMSNHVVDYYQFQDIG